MLLSLLNVGASAVRARETAIESQQLLILVVEDEPQEYEKTCALLEKVRYLRFDLCWARTYEEGLEEVHNGKAFDLCLLDYELGDRDGVDFLREAIQAGFQAPIIMLSGGNSIAHDITALREGAADYLSKRHIKPSFLERSIRFALERKRRRDSVIQAEKQLMYSQKMRSLGELATSMTHELNNTLDAVVGHLDLIAIKAEKGSEIARSASLALDSTERARLFIEHIYSFSAPELPLNEKVNLNQLVLETSDLLGRILPRTVHVKTQLARGKEFSILAHPAQIRQMLIAIAKNAEEAMPDGGSLEVFIEKVDCRKAPLLKHGCTPGDYARLSIKDSGLGIPEENVEQIFEPTFTTKQNTSNLGLGLPTVYRMMENHQGWVEIESCVGIGTTVHLYFFLQEDKEQSLRKRAVSQKETKNSRMKGKILVIEDQVVLAELMKLYLEAAGFEAHVCFKPREALRWYKEHSADVALVVLDLNLPEIDGKEVFKELKKIREDVKIALCSGSFDESVQELLDQGALRFFQKPGRYPTMVTWIAEVLSQES